MCRMNRWWVLLMGLAVPGCFNPSELPDLEEQGTAAGSGSVLDGGDDGLCGNGSIDLGEVCDDGLNDGAYEGCNPGCQAFGPRCGDGMIQSDAGEACDDGNRLGGDLCSSDCTAVTSPEECAAERGIDKSDTIFVSPGGDDAEDCGTEVEPCETVEAGLLRALASERGRVALAEGNYETRLELPAGIDLSGGWLVENGVFGARCGDAAAELVTLTAPQVADTTVSLVDTGGLTTLEYLTIRSKGAQFVGAGESIYGVKAIGAGTELLMSLVNVEVVGGGAGIPGDVGGDGANGVGSCADDSDGADGGPGEPGEPGVASFSRGGFGPVDGRSGTNGEDGHNGTLGSTMDLESDTCDVLRTDSCSCGVEPRTAPRGLGGCGGLGGAGGEGGGGGGASIGLYVFDATVTVKGGTLLAGDGGAGANGARGGLGGAGADGETGRVDCPGLCLDTSCDDGVVCGNDSDCRVGNVVELIGSTGGPGGDGGTGGMGGSGGGGDSLSYFASPNALVTFNSTTQFGFGAPGQGGEGAPNGIAGTTRSAP